MEHSSRRDLLAGLAAMLPAVAPRPPAEPAATAPAPGGAAPGQLRVNPPNQSVKRRG